MLKRILIVGGGSAGWMCASYLSKVLDGVEVALIESSDIPVIGVGESTVPPIVDFMRLLGLKEEDWMPKCNAVFKSSICFKNFYRTEDPHFWYPFEPMGGFMDRPVSRYWLHKHWNDPAFRDRFSFYDYCYLVPEICRQKKTVRSIPNATYAYHFDAGLLGEYLKHYCKDRGVTHIVDTITEINLGENGNITSVGRSNGAPIEADLFVDCSGFRSLLLAGKLQEPFDSYYDYLFNDRAVAMRVPYRDKENEMLSYTLCEAQSAGWIWTIPLYSRIGTGYVYCSRYKTEDQAETEFRRYWGEDRVKDLNVSHIKIRVGKHQRTWVKNCVAIGLAAGFIEPLESTGLFIAQGAIQTLGDTLRGRNEYNAGDVKVYNDSVSRMIEIIRDFLVCHYGLTSREDTPYWRDVKYGTKFSDSLSAKLQLARLAMPDTQYIGSFDNASLAGFSFGDGWQCILTAMNYLPFERRFLKARGVGPYEPHVIKNMPAANARLETLRNQAARVGQLPNHYQFLKDVYYNGQDVDC
jgi:tryptophan halogenase